MAGIKPISSSAEYLGRPLPAAKPRPVSSDVAASAKPVPIAADVSRPRPTPVPVSHVYRKPVPVPAQQIKPVPTPVPGVQIKPVPVAVAGAPVAAADVKPQPVAKPAELNPTPIKLSDPVRDEVVPDQAADVVASAVPVKTASQIVKS